MMRALANLFSFVPVATNLLTYFTGSDLGAHHGKPFVHGSQVGTIGIQIRQSADGVEFAYANDD